MQQKARHPLPSEVAAVEKDDRRDWWDEPLHLERARNLIAAVQR